MNSIFRGEPITKEAFISRIDEFKMNLAIDLRQEKLDQEIVINAIANLVMVIDRDELINKLTDIGLPKWAIKDYIDVFISSLTREELYIKMSRELGEEPFNWNTVTGHIEEKMAPLGVIMHIGAGNALGLSAFSVLEGLLTGNINLLKLPEYEGGISLEILLKLVEIEPRLKPYIYVLDVSSKNETVIKQLIECVDAIAVWGSDEAVTAIRQMTPPTISIIEWGHRMSFSYFTDTKINDLVGLAKDIVTTDQLYCSSPQCVFFETDCKEDLIQFASTLSDCIDELTEQYPSSDRTMDVQSQITWTHELIKMEELLNEKKLISNNISQYSVMVDYEPKLIPSPLFRNIWVMPIERDQLFNLLRRNKGHLQTVGLSCECADLDELSTIFYAAGVNRIMPCGEMSLNYSGEPHDGIYALRRYVRIVNRKIK
ncbi:acyl-CoA reductase [Haloplasma contractile]|uniref:long-chain-fatty-acyl-CoA reductase n=1 Tax=Haloplasma contractile SSD-17B TaxID=1033810 RepID=F7Q218_9MOLU|nr:acyl-CoA reductase [Haloplasma contractile]ERJ12174.1 phenylacetate-CoA ligase protein [Haloplasma contractile SSD-17B]